ncbi:hypothetical protein DIX90_09000 [Streptococcus iniae]|uniref:hypothetical protein n=1 Tax=Streptococcus iniae TaxID=1346 RepID=UPI000EF6CC0E|nr:hypothetical protein [Streptococcus iniae]RLU51573.1 hypothetical protein DIY04_10600 [Streptococcus iniae]RLU58557.1 hypothetical protein DIY02_08985 [Streptococcus iniae]RLU60549.1 hypothetical protein DIY01_08805 [Streptococcus iniae]RLU68709.1 hypothetical protein DIX97_09115 [Streptococcus iniae]RLU82699.1 hypothetical protein DIX91_08770 [Streptococcus iniae]
MNKQEAIKKVNDLLSFTLEDGPFEFDLINKRHVIDIISQIHEPQKSAKILNGHGSLRSLWR